MTPYIQDPDFTLYVGDVLAVAAAMDDSCVDAIVTSPPYWGLRDYGVEPTSWPGVVYSPMTGVPPVAISPMTCALGLEDDPAAFVGHIVAVFRELHHVLADHGSVWLNFGDSYVGKGSGTWGNGNSTLRAGRVYDADEERQERAGSRDKYRPELPDKNLAGIPWRVAFALQADGWWLRSDNIWNKTNVMPSSATDRPTIAHEYVFQLTKSPRYFFDQNAVREPAKWERWGKQTTPKHDGEHERYSNMGRDWTEDELEEMRERGRNMRSVWEIPTRPYEGAHFAVFPPELPEKCIAAGSPQEVCSKCGRPRECECAYPGMKPGDLDVIASPTGDGGGEDQKLARGRAGLGRERREDEGRRLMTRYEQRKYAEQLRASPALKNVKRIYGDTTVDHWIRTDRAGARAIPPEILESFIAAGTLERVALPTPAAGSYRPGVVLDPFMGSGTTALAARKLRRHAVGIERSPEFARLCAGRLQQLSLPV